MAKWVICCGMMRSGSTLQYQIVKEIVEMNEIGLGLGYFNNNDLIKTLSAFHNDNTTYVVKIHHYFELPTGLSKNDFKFIYSFRDIRDVVVSLMNFEQKEFINIFNQFRFYQLQVQHYRWLKKNGIYISKYEDFVLDIPREIINISSFLNIDISESSIKRLSKKLSISQQEHQIVNSQTIEKYDCTYSPETLLHKNHINSGEIGQWKDQLSNFQIASVEYSWKDWLLQNNYSLNRSIYRSLIMFKLASLYRKLYKQGILGVISQRINKIRNAKKRKIERHWDQFIMSNNGDIEKIVWKNIRIKLYKDSTLSGPIYKESFERKEQKFVYNQLQKGDVFFDVGANIGLYTLLAAKAVGETGRVFSFEPVNKTFSRLKENVDFNEFVNCRLFNLAISDKNGKNKIITSREGYDAFNSMAIPSVGGFFNKEDIETITLTSFCNEHNIDKIDFLKVDVEGWEVHVIKGAKEVLEKFSPTIMIEFTDKNLINAGQSAKDLFNLLTSQGYKLNKINDDLTLCPEKLKPEYPYENLIAIKEII